MKVLHFSAEPVGEPDLALSAELRGIADALLPGRARKDTSLDVVPQTRPSDVVCYLETMQPDIVQFSSHGTRVGLELCDAYFDPVTFSPKELRDALEGRHVRLLILNCCSSWHIAEWVLGRKIPARGKRDDGEVPEEMRLITGPEPLTAVVDVVVFTERKLPEDRAHIFSETFYRSLQAGMRIGDAFAMAQRELGSGYSDLYGCEAKEEAGKALSLLTNPAETGSDVPSAQRRSLTGSGRFEEERIGARLLARENGLKLGLWVIVAIAVSCVARGGWDTGILSWLTATFGWVKLEPWLLFTFFAAPPALYLAEYLWLKRALTDAERAAFWLALSPPPSEDTTTIADRIEAMVAELDSARDALGGGRKND
ncbi:MAG: hypothetical protein R3E82_15265 [Pseudomonadales bacterium]|nr:hypothetical protein [Pseudomonadales bacterium]